MSQVSLIKPRDTVRYLSRTEDLKAIDAVVVAVYIDRAVIRHETRPYYTTISIERLVKVGEPL